MINMFRRDFLLGSSALVLGQAGKSLASGDETTGLKDRAARRGMTYGCALGADQISRQPLLVKRIVQECGILVPENDLKWRVTGENPVRPDYSRGESLVRFATQHGMLLRGHTAAWYKSQPDWAVAALTSAEAVALVIERVQSVVGHFSGRIVEWDVVNEAVEPRDGLPNRLRNSPEYRYGGLEYIADCFHAARGADPKAKLYYNDYGLEYDSEDEEARRRGVLDLLSALKAANTPVDGLGIQSHLKVGNRFNAERFRRFLGDVASLGLEIRLTELDVNDERVQGDPIVRDEAVASHARAFLAAALEETAVRGVLTWGLSDSTSWLSSTVSRRDGSKPRPLPLDAMMLRKPLWTAIAESFDGAPIRN